jgi:transposase
MKIKQIGIDIGKNASHLIALGVDGGIAWRKQFSRSWLLSFLESTVGECPRVTFEACSGAHWLAHRLLAMGYAVQLLTP